MAEARAFVAWSTQMPEIRPLVIARSAGEAKGFVAREIEEAGYGGFPSRLWPSLRARRAPECDSAAAELEDWEVPGYAP